MGRVQARCVRSHEARSASRALQCEHEPAAGALCLPRRAREKRPTRRSNGPPAAWIYFTQIHESTYENHRSVIGELAPLSIIPRAADASRTSRPVQEYCED